MDDDDPPNVMTSISRHELTAVAQRDLLHWLNQTLQTDYGQITDVNDGIAHLQILDAIWPGSSVPLHRLNFHPRTRDDRERNLRVVRQTLQRLRVVEDAPLDVEAIAKGGASSFSACNDFLRWCHAVVQRNCPAVSRKYDGHGRRREAQTRQSRSSPSSANRRKGTPPAGNRWGPTSSFSPTSFTPKGCFLPGPLRRALGRVAVADDGQARGHVRVRQRARGLREEASTAAVRGGAIVGAGVPIKRSRDDVHAAAWDHPEVPDPREIVVGGVRARRRHRRRPTETERGYMGHGRRRQGRGRRRPGSCVRPGCTGGRPRREPGGRGR